MSKSFHRVVKGDDIEERGLADFIVNGWPVAIGRDGGNLYAVINRCTHAASALAPEGRVRRGSVMCPLHGARFKLDTGECLGGANYKPLMTYALRETDDGWLEVEVPDEAPGHEHMPVKSLV